MTFELTDTDRKIDHIKSKLEGLLGVSGVSVNCFPVPTCTMSSADTFNAALNYFHSTQLKRLASFHLYFEARLPAQKDNHDAIPVRIQLYPPQEPDFKKKYGAQYTIPTL